LLTDVRLVDRLKQLHQKLPLTTSRQLQSEVRGLRQLSTTGFGSGWDRYQEPNAEKQRGGVWAAWTPLPLPPTCIPESRTFPDHGSHSRSQCEVGQNRWTSSDWWSESWIHW